MLLHSPSRRLCSDVSQMFFDQGVGSTSLLRMIDGEEAAMRCNLHTLQIIALKSK